MASDGWRFVQTSVEVYEYVRSLVAENKRLREALEIIAGTRPCLDDLMSDKDVARAALEEES